MTTLEDTVRSVFEEDAQAAPDGTDVVRRVIERSRRRQRTRRAGITVGLVAAATAAIAVVPSLVDGDGRPDRSTTAPRASTSPTSPTDGATRGGPLFGGAAVTCVERYSAREVMDRAFAFDGTVTEIGPGNTDRGDEGDLGYAGVTFEVHEWYRGGSAPTITIDLGPPDAAVDGRPAYDVGTRLLVSGEHRWGGATDADLLGWGCGFTRYYDPATAAAWRRAAG